MRVDKSVFYYGAFAKEISVGETYQFYWAGCLVVVSVISVIVFLLLLWSAKQKKYYRQHSEAAEAIEGRIRKCREVLQSSDVEKEKKLKEIIRGLLPTMATIFLFFGILTFLFQVFLYLREGVWHSISLCDALIFISYGDFQEWLLHPSSWIGIKNIISVIPLSIFSIGLSIGILWYYVVGD